MYYSAGAHEGYSCPEGIEKYSIIFEEKEDLISTVLEGNVLGYNTVNVGSNTDELPLKYEYFAVDALAFLNLKLRKVWLKNRSTGESIEVEFKDSDVVVLPAGTNDVFDEPAEDVLLFKKNKWIICHDKNEALIERGVYPGIHGENYQIKYK